MKWNAVFLNSVMNKLEFSNDHQYVRAILAQIVTMEEIGLNRIQEELKAL